MKNLKIYFTSDLHGYVYPTDYIDRSQKNIGLLNIINQFEKDGNTLMYQVWAIITTSNPFITINICIMHTMSCICPTIV